MTRHTFILNVGFARSGTTAAATFMRNHPAISVPAKRKELKYFLKEDVSAEDYVAQFKMARPVLFEASPPYTHRGVDDFRTYMTRAAQMVDAGHRVIVLFGMRNFVKRAFSHYWHDISSHYAIYGARWSCRSLDDPARYRSLYRKSFAQQVTEDGAIDKFLPQSFAMINIALDIFGPDNVRIYHMKHLDASLHEICDLAGLDPVSGTRTFKIKSAAAPRYLRWEDKIPAKLTAALDHRLANGCLLLSRWHSEILDGQRYDLDHIVEASHSWTYTLEGAELPAKVVAHTRDQTEKIATLPDRLFLQAAKSGLVQELQQIPEHLEMGRMSLTPADMDALLETVARS